MCGKYQPMFSWGYSFQYRPATLYATSILSDTLWVFVNNLGAGKTLKFI